MKTNDMTKIYHVKERLKTDLKAVNPFLDRVSQDILTLTDSKEEAFKIKLALEEAVVNAMRHGNRLDRERHVAVHIEADKKGVKIDVHDEGKGFDFRVLPDPTRGEKVHLPSGRGVYLMRKLMDKVEFYDAGSGVIMTKSFRPSP
ncbi:MAG: ATP-binding protein [Candidatus Omnitrophota bacterium]